MRFGDAGFSAHGRMDIDSKRASHQGCDLELGEFLEFRRNISRRCQMMAHAGGEVEQFRIAGLNARRKRNSAKPTPDLPKDPPRPESSLLVLDADGSRTRTGASAGIGARVLGTVFRDASGHSPFLQCNSVQDDRDISLSRIPALRPEPSAPGPSPWTLDAGPGCQNGMSSSEISVCCENSSRAGAGRWSMPAVVRLGPLWPEPSSRPESREISFTTISVR